MTPKTDSHVSEMPKPVIEVHAARGDIVFLTFPEDTLLHESRVEVPWNAWLKRVSQRIGKSILRFLIRGLQRLVERLALTAVVLVIFFLVWVVLRGAIVPRELFIVTQFISAFAFFASYLLPRFLTKKNGHKNGTVFRWLKRVFLAMALLVTFPFAILPWVPSVASAIRVKCLVIKDPKGSYLWSDAGVQELSPRGLRIAFENGILFEKPNYQYDGTLANLQTVTMLDEVTEVLFRNVHWSRDMTYKMPPKEAMRAVFTPRTKEWLETRKLSQIVLDNTQLPIGSSERENLDYVLTQLADVAVSIISLQTDLQHSPDCVEKIGPAPHVRIGVTLDSIAYQSSDWYRSLQNMKTLSANIETVSTKHFDAEVADALQHSNCMRIQCDTISADALSSLTPDLANSLSLLVYTPDIDQIRTSVSHWRGSVLDLQLPNTRMHDGLLNAIPESVTVLTLIARLKDVDLADYNPSPNLQVITLHGVEFTKPAILEFLKRFDAQAKKRADAPAEPPFVRIVPYSSFQHRSKLSRRDMEEIFETIQDWQPGFVLSLE